MLSQKPPLQSRKLRRPWVQQGPWLWLFALGLVLGLAGVPRAVGAADAMELRIVVHPSNAARSAEPSFLADAFLKKVTRWPNGETIRPLDQVPSNPVRRLFSRSILKRTVTAVRSYWQQRIFSGRDVPPPELDSDAAVIAYVERNPGAIGYVSSSAKLGGTRELQFQ
jgi:hypothetical protein